ncbi:MAG: alternative ribosome rescue aminoacyl-tRNA hydrolase ArfB [Pseudomonadota bacterium]
MYTISDVPDNEVEISAIRAGGPGGQHVNKVATAIHLRYDIKKASLPEFIRRNLLQLKDSRISQDGVVIIKSQQFRSQEKNKQAALDRLDDLLRAAQKVRKKRRATRPSKASVERRLSKKKQKGTRKQLRGKVDY